MSMLHACYVRVARPLAIFACTSLLVLGCVPGAFAVVANPDPFEEAQPDGTRVMLRVRGDEHFSWAEDLEGYTVIQRKGWYEYARLNPQGRLVPSGLRVGHDRPQAYGLKPGLLPSRSARSSSAKVSPGDSVALLESAALSGAVRNLVVLVQFSDHVGRALPLPGEVEVLFNAPGGDTVLAPTGSIRDVYLQNSYGKLDLSSDISGWITVSNTEHYYANGVSGDDTIWEALREALSELDRTVDFRQYDSDADGNIDSIAFLHSGYGAEWGASDSDGAAFTDRIWSHRWTISPAWVSEEGVQVSRYHISPALWGTAGSEIGRIGVIAHETGHFLGLPDLYDTDGGGSGIGSYGLMANSWGFDGSQLCPPQLSPWSKLQLGWINPETISASGRYELAQSASSNEFFIVSAGFPENEFLIIENRQPAGFDCSLPQGGLAVWHIDDLAAFDEEGFPEKRWPENGKHYRVALAQADGQFHLERGVNRGDGNDLHHASAVDAMAPGPDGHPNTDAYQRGRIVATGHVITDVSEAAPVMSFCLNGCPVEEPGGSDTFAAPNNLSATIQGSDKGRLVTMTVALNWNDNSNGKNNEDQFVIERCLETGKGNRKRCDFAPHATVERDVNSFSEPAGDGSYRYRVKARKLNGDETAYSNEARI